MALAQHKVTNKTTPSPALSPKSMPTTDQNKSNSQPRVANNVSATGNSSADMSTVRTLPPLEPQPSPQGLPFTSQARSVQNYLANGRRGSTDPALHASDSQRHTTDQAHHDRYQPYPTHHSNYSPNTEGSSSYQFNPQFAQNGHLAALNANMGRRRSYQDGPSGIAAQPSPPSSRRPSVISEYSLSERRDSKDSIATSNSDVYGPYSEIRRHSIAVADGRNSSMKRKTSADEAASFQQQQQYDAENYPAKRRGSAFDTRLGNLSLYDRRNSYATSSAPPSPPHGRQPPGPEHHQQFYEQEGSSSQQFHPGFARQPHLAPEGPVITRRASMPVIHSEGPPPPPPIPPQQQQGMDIDPRYRYPAPPPPMYQPNYQDTGFPHGPLQNPMLTGLMKETPYSRSPELRVSHKLAERKRRKEMKELFDELRDALPVDKSLKTSKWEILSKAVDYIASMKHNEGEMVRELHALRSEVTRCRQHHGRYEYHQPGQQQNQQPVQPGQQQNQQPGQQNQQPAQQSAQQSAPTNSANTDTPME